jgi:hypothetical protein
MPPLYTVLISPPQFTQAAREDLARLETYRQAQAAYLEADRRVKQAEDEIERAYADRVRADRALVQAKDALLNS